MQTEVARAKINLTLHVGRVIRDADRFYGYHPLDSLVVFADIGDRIEVSPAKTFELNIGGPFEDGLDPGEDNLITRAVRAAGRLGADTNVRIDLHKALPVASGVGGGSADAAATLRALCGDKYDLSETALQLGADVPVCLLSETMRMTGIGETLTPLPGLGSVSAVLCNPGVAVSTAEIFAAFDSGDVKETPRPQSHEGSLLERALEGRNDLQPYAVAKAPIIQEVIDALDAAKACQFARMSGSGATCFGLFETDAQAKECARELTQKNWWAVACRLGDDEFIHSSSNQA
jgi:4-diphosphocytidyl-2-C-methyl-D-erythritol kinase